MATNKPCGDAKTSELGTRTSEERIKTLARGATLHTHVDTDDEDSSLERPEWKEKVVSSDTVATCSLCTLNPIDPVASERREEALSWHALKVGDPGNLDSATSLGSKNMTEDSPRSC